MTNLVEILKNAPKGLELYSPVGGNVKLYSVKPNDMYPIVVENSIKNVFSFDKYGRINEYGECCLFPSKECKNWNEWQKVLFKPGHFITAIEVTFYIKSKLNCDFNVIYKNGDTGKINPVTAFNFAPTGKIEQFYAELERYGYTLINGKLEKRKDNKADVLLEEFLKEFKTTLVDSKSFTIDDFKPFDKVLVFISYLGWSIDLFSSYKKHETFPYRCLTYCYDKCVPYNDETKHLLGTTEEYNGKYKTW